MAQELKSVSVANPGFLGLNTQQTGVGLDVSWASEASNCIISKDGGVIITSFQTVISVLIA